jgi:demethylmenaquinone methyltransferase/2-methoxy-6-polyprenyl-1,4-benzoquinol methylase
MTREAPEGTVAAELPAGVAAAVARAEAAGFRLSCDPDVGRFLAVLAAGVPANGRVLEMGTGAGVGTAWIVHGLGERTDAEVISVEMDPALHAAVAAAPWPGHVSLRRGDVLAILDDLGTFDLVFADAQGGKWEGLDRTIGVLRQRGLLLVDDMTPETFIDEVHRRRTEEVRRTLLSHPQLVGAEIQAATGMILVMRR